MSLPTRRYLLDGIKVYDSIFLNDNLIKQETYYDIYYETIGDLVNLSNLYFDGMGIEILNDLNNSLQFFILKPNEIGVLEIKRIKLVLPSLGYMCALDFNDNRVGIVDLVGEDKSTPSKIIPRFDITKYTTGNITSSTPYKFTLLTTPSPAPAPISRRPSPAPAPISRRPSPAPAPPPIQKLVITRLDYAVNTVLRVSIGTERGVSLRAIDYEVSYRPNSAGDNILTIVPNSNVFTIANLKLNTPYTFTFTNRRNRNEFVRFNYTVPRRLIITKMDYRENNTLKVNITTDALGSPPLRAIDYNVIRTPNSPSIVVTTSSNVFQIAGLSSNTSYKFTFINKNNIYEKVDYNYKTKVFGGGSRKKNKKSLRRNRKVKSYKY